MSGRMEFWSVYQIEEDGEETRICLAEDNVHAKQVENALTAHADAGEKYEIRHEEIVADVDLNIREY